MTTSNTSCRRTGHHRLPAKAVGLFFLLSLLAGAPAFAQFNILQRVKDKAQERADQKVDQGIDKSLDQTENAAKEASKNDGSQQSDAPGAKTDKKSGRKTGKDSAPTNSGQGTSAVPTSSLTAYSKYDFVPGEKVAFFDDFATAAIGDFPANWNTSGTGEVVTVGGLPGRWLRWSAGVGYAPMLKGPLPENFTLEFDILMTAEEGKLPSYFGLNIYANGKDEWESNEGVGSAGIFLVTQGEWEVTKWNAAGEGERVGGSSQVHNSQLYGKSAHVSVWGQKQRLRIYVNQTKVLDLPQALPTARLNRIKFTNNPGVNISNDEEAPVYLTNVRIATGLPDVRSKLLSEGHLVTRGILFDVNSDKIRGESYGTLKEIAQVLKENPALKVKIVGHTDSDGADAANLDLSKRRAAAVKSTLERDFGVAVGDYQTDGKGESAPVSPNATPEGKANNRRVEFIKI